MTFRASVLTLYPDMFPGPLGASLAGKALEQGITALTEAKEEIDRKDGLLAEMGELVVGYMHLMPQDAGRPCREACV